MRDVQHVQVRNKFTKATATVPESSLRLHRPAGWEPVDDDAPAAGAAPKTSAGARAEEPRSTESTAAAIPARRDEKKEK